MAENYYYVTKEKLDELNMKYEEWKAKTDNPAEYSFAGFAARQTLDHNMLFFHPLYESSLGRKSVVFTEVVTAGECPNPPGYTEPIPSWPDNLQPLVGDEPSQTDQAKSSSDTRSEDKQEPSK